MAMERLREKKEGDNIERKAEGGRVKGKMG
jgi:hypothetical protein